MINKMFAVYDVKVGVFQNPFLMRNRAAAIRGFADVVNDKTTQFYVNPDDFTLMELGDFDDETGVLTQPEEPLVVINAVELMKEPLGPKVQ